MLFVTSYDEGRGCLIINTVSLTWKANSQIIVFLIRWKIENQLLLNVGKEYNLIFIRPLKMFIIYNVILTSVKQPFNCCGYVTGPFDKSMLH